MQDHDLLRQIPARPDIGSLLREYQEEALRMALGEQTPLERGRTEGSLLDPRQKEPALAAIRAAFHRQQQRLSLHLQQLRQEMQTELALRKDALARTEAQRQQMETNLGGRQIMEAAGRDLAMALRQSQREHQEMQQQQAREHAGRLKAIEDAVEAEMALPDRPADLRHLTALTLRLGQPTADDRGKGYWAFFRKRLEEAAQDRKQRADKIFREQREQARENHRLHTAALFEQTSAFPSRGQAWLFTILTLVIFSIEIPINFHFAAPALGIDVKSEPVMTCLLAIGLPLVLGLAAKVWLNGSMEQQKHRLRRAILLFGLPMVFSLGLLNGFSEMNAAQRDAYQLDLLVPLLRFLVFANANLLLSTIGAVFFEWSLQHWNRRRLLSSGGRRPEDYREKMEECLVRTAVLRHHILCLEGHLEQIDQALYGSPERQESAVDRSFAAARGSAEKTYLYGFATGWRSRLATLLRHRRPIPSSAGLHS